MKYDIPQKCFYYSSNYWNQNVKHIRNLSFSLWQFQHNQADENFIELIKNEEYGGY